MASSHIVLLALLRRPPRPTLFPYTTLFRTATAPVRVKRSRRRTWNRIRGSLRGGALVRTGSGGRSALDGARDDALGEVLLEEGVDHDDRCEGHDDDGHLDRLRWRGLLHAELIGGEGAALDDVAAQD